VGGGNSAWRIAVLYYVCYIILLPYCTLILCLNIKLQLLYLYGKQEKRCDAKLKNIKFNFYQSVSLSAIIK